MRWVFVCQALPYGNIANREIKYYLLRYTVFYVEPKVGKMIKKMEMCEQFSPNERPTAQDKVELTMRKLQALKVRISELRHQCEELKKMPRVVKSDAMLCDGCGGAVESGQEIVFKDSSGTKRHYYHKGCFSKLWQ
jgi:hypothetical protein